MPAKRSSTDLTRLRVARTIVDRAMSARSPAPRRHREPDLQIWNGAPKTNRTSDLPLRRGSLYPLSYRGVARIVADRFRFPKDGCGTMRLPGAGRDKLPSRERGPPLAI